ncbi:MAG TPA: hypothetical protein VGB38_01500, partial [bacterium]
ARYLLTSANDLLELRLVSLPLLDMLGKRPRPVESQLVSEGLYMPVLAKTYQASAIFRYFKQLPKPDSECIRSLNQSSLELIRMFRSIHFQKNPDELDKTWLSSLHMLMNQVLPFLSPEQMSILWKDLDRAPAAAALSDSIKAWLRLYRAVANRDVPAMLKHATALLPDSTISSGNANQYCLSAAMLANIVMGNDQKAVDLWNRYENKKTPPITLLLLKETASQHLEPLRLNPIFQP